MRRQQSRPFEAAPRAQLHPVIDAPRDQTVTTASVSICSPRSSGRLARAAPLDNRAIGPDTPDQLARGAERRDAAGRLQRLGFRAYEAADRRLPRRAVNAHLRNLARPGIQMRFERFPGSEAAASNGVLLHITDAVLGLAFGASAIRRTRSWPAATALRRALAARNQA